MPRRLSPRRFAAQHDVKIKLMASKGLKTTETTEVAWRLLHVTDVYCPNQECGSTFPPPTGTECAPPNCFSFHPLLPRVQQKRQQKPTGIPQTGGPRQRGSGVEFSGEAGRCSRAGKPAPGQ